MASKIRWTLNAIDDLDFIVKYLNTNWGERIKQNFIQILNTKLELLSLFSTIGFKIFPSKNIRALLISKHSRLYYRANKDFIIILRLFDTRKDPGKFKL